MAKRENEKKKNEALEELEIVHAATTASDKQNVVFSPISRKKKLRRKLRKSKSAIASSRGQFAKSYVFDSKRDRDRGSIKVQKKLNFKLFVNLSKNILVGNNNHNSNYQKSRFA